LTAKQAAAQPGAGSVRLNCTADAGGAHFAEGDFLRLGFRPQRRPWQSPPRVGIEGWRDGRATINHKMTPNRDGLLAFRCDAMFAAPPRDTRRRQRFSDFAN